MSDNTYFTFVSETFFLFYFNVNCINNTNVKILAKYFENIAYHNKICKYKSMQNTAEEVVKPCIYIM